MGEVARISLEFPTVIFTVLLGISAVLWLVSLAGFGDAEDATDGFLDGLLHPVGLAGVPPNVLLSLFGLFGWATSALLQIGVLQQVSGLTAAIVGIGILVVAIAVATFVMRLIAPKLSRTFTPELAHRADDLVGRIVEIRSSVASATTGYADVRAPDGNLNRIDVRVRPDRGADLTFHGGDHALIIAYNPSDHVYIIDETPIP